MESAMTLDDVMSREWTAKALNTGAIKILLVRWAVVTPRHNLKITGRLLQGRIEMMWRDARSSMRESARESGYMRMMTPLEPVDEPRESDEQ